MDFEKAYKQLNPKQKEAVDTIEGPVMVVAGPGTGKTQLLAMRAANILRKDSTLLPTNILCLTFTESGQVAMQRRLIELMGEAGAHVAVHTFHSFGTEIINSYPEYFYRGSHYSPADDLTIYEILSEILKNLPHRNPLSAQRQNELVYLKSVKNRLEQIKKAALTPEELRQLIADGLQFVDYIEETLVGVFDTGRFGSKQDILRSEQLTDLVLNYQQPALAVSGFKPLSQIFNETFSLALNEAQETGKTTSLNAWKKVWFAKDKNLVGQCKQREILEKLSHLVNVYQKYRDALDDRKLFDFDDMIVRVVQALESRGDLAYELQEQYQYFLVDEFQDTNAGQLRLLHALANHPVNEQRPNVMVVGDDDQAIYAFQGAELSNILGFKDSYRDVKLITLTDNYRSAPKLLSTTRQLIVQGTDRLETHYQEIDKTLSAKTDAKSYRIERQLFTHQSHEYEWVAQQIGELLKKGHPPSEIAVICREHKYLEKILPYLDGLNISVSYERQQNSLNNPQIKELIVLAKVVEALASQDEVTANGLLPELLSADYWQIPATDIWLLSLVARRKFETTHKQVFWLKLMLSGKHGQKLRTVARFLLEVAKQSRVNSLENILDRLVGNSSESLAQETYEETEAVTKKSTSRYTSPFKSYYFDDEILQNKPANYINLLNCLTSIRDRLRKYRADTNLNLGDFVRFVDLCNEAKIPINASGVYDYTENSVQLMTAHRSKGLEFNTVFIISAVKKVWDSKGRNEMLQLAPNMQQVAHTGNLDDNLRVFYVATTRAKNNLIITGYLKEDDGKEVASYGAIEAPAIQALLPRPKKPLKMPSDPMSQLNRTERQWFDNHRQLPHKTMKELLSARLDTYKLSVTHLNNFLDVSQGGPINFLLGNLLQFPSAMNPGAAFGSAMHESLQYLHNYFLNHKSLPTLDDILKYFDSSLKLKRLGPVDENNFLERGHLALEKLIQERGEDINARQTPEQNFFAQGVTLGDAKLTGKIDVLEINKRQANVIDYKTGSAINNWKPQNKTTYEKIKMHKYAQQLYFYKLLVEGSRTWGDQGVKLNSAELVFVEPNSHGHISVLELDLNDKQELERLSALIKAVWQRIINLDFPDISEYSPDVKGIRAFEDYLVDNYK